MPRTALLLASAMFLAPLAARADEPEPIPPPPAPYAVYLAPSAPPAEPSSEAELPPEEDGPFVPQEGRGPKRGMRKAGIVLTFVGIGVAALGGAVLGASASGRPSGEYGGAMRDAGMGIGGAVLAVGGTSILVGIPLWAVGAASFPSSQQ